MKEYSINVAYSSQLWSAKKDAEIERVAGRRRDSSGMGFGVRDLQFYFKTKRSAEISFEKLKKIKSVKVTFGEQSI